MSNKNLLGKESIAEKMQKLKNEMNIQQDQPSKKSSSKEVKSKTTPHLFISGRLDRKKHMYVAKSLVLLTDLENEIKAYCRGGELAILNYLIKEGLKNVKNSPNPINVDIEEIETNIN